MAIYGSVKLDVNQAAPTSCNFDLKITGNSAFIISRSSHMQFPFHRLNEKNYLSETPQTEAKINNIYISFSLGIWEFNTR